jgi:hypothetical protein
MDLRPVAVDTRGMRRLTVVAALLATCLGAASSAAASGARASSDRASSRTTTSGQSHGFGLRPVTHSTTHPGQRPRIGSIATPVAVDLSAWTVPVGNQGMVNSCVTWAIDYAMLGWYSRREGHSGQPFAPMYAYSQIQAMHGWHDDGAYVEDGLAIAEQQGVDSQADYTQGNYDWWTQPTAAEHANAAPHRTYGSTFLFATYPQPPGDGARWSIQSAIAAGHPVALSIPVYDAFEQLSAASHLLDAADVATSSVLGYHEVLVVGYDATGIRIQNSWGSGWADHGFANLAWDFVEQLATDASVMTGFADVTSVSPAVVAITPSHGPVGGGSAVTIRGLALSTATGVRFGSTPASSFQVVDDGTIVAETPAMTSSAFLHVRVTGPGGASAATAADGFSYDLPHVTSMWPARAVTTGTTVTFHGTRLAQTTAVRVGGVLAVSWSVVDDTTLRAVTPAHRPGAATVQLTVGSTSFAVGTFHYIGPPRVRRISRATATVAVIHGDNLGRARVVMFGRHRARILAASAHRLRVRIPATGGAVRVRVVTPYGVSRSSRRSVFR